MTGLTEKQAETLDFLDRFITAEGKPPSVREVMVGVKVASSARAQEVLDALEERGFISRLPHRARSIEVLRRRPGADLPLPGVAALSRASTEDLHRLRRDLAEEILRRSQDRAVLDADAHKAGVLADV